MLVQRTKLKDRVKLFIKVIDLADELFNLNNFSRFILIPHSSF